MSSEKLIRNNCNALKQTSCTIQFLSEYFGILLIELYGISITATLYEIDFTATLSSSAVQLCIVMQV